MVDELFAAAPGAAPRSCARIFRAAMIDVNREPYELDPKIFEAPLPSFANTRSLRVAGGLGALPVWLPKARRFTRTASRWPKL